MLKNEFAVGLLKETPDAMASQLAMWDNLSLWNVALKKADGLFSRQDELRVQLDSDSRRIIKTLNVHQLRVQILCRVAEQAEFPLPNKFTVGDFDDFCERLCKHALQVLRETDKTFSGNSTREMSEHVLKKMFADLSKRFDSGAFPNLQ